MGRSIRRVVLLGVAFVLMAAPLGGCASADRSRKPAGSVPLTSTVQTVPVPAEDAGRVSTGSEGDRSGCDRGDPVDCMQRGCDRGFQFRSLRSNHHLTIRTEAEHRIKRNGQLALALSRVVSQFVSR